MTLKMRKSPIRPCERKSQTFCWRSMFNTALSVPILEYKSHLSGGVKDRTCIKYLHSLSRSRSPQIHRGAEQTHRADVRKASLVPGWRFSLQLRNLEPATEGCRAPGRRCRESQRPGPPTRRAQRVLGSEHEYATRTARCPASRFINRVMRTHFPCPHLDPKQLSEQRGCLNIDTRPPKVSEPGPGEEPVAILPAAASSTFCETWG